jgi:hypothetical protein
MRVVPYASAIGSLVYAMINYALDLIYVLQFAWSADITQILDKHIG